MLVTVPPLSVKLSALLPPVRFSILEKALPLTSPPFTTVTFQVLIVLSPVTPSLPPPPSMLVTVPPLSVKVSALLPPVRFSILEKVLPLTSPPFTAVTFQVLIALSPVTPSLPAPPSMLATVPPLSVKASALLPPVKFSILENVLPLISPAFAAVTFQVLIVLSPVTPSSPAPPSMSATVPPLRLKVSVLLPPVRFSILEKVLPLTLPAFAAVTFQVLTVLSPLKPSLPKPPSMSATVPPLRLKVSVLLPPVRFSILEKVLPLTSPPFTAVTFQVLIVLSPVKPSSPAPPSMSATVPPLRLKVSVLLPPVRVSILEKALPLTSPAFTAVIFQVLTILSPVKLLLPALPSMLVTVPPFRAKLSMLVPPVRV